ncbi:MAG: hypothetical protein Q8936_14360 [Bacillota bacterium]|nr:hypothetical protein [Bacillota bacterium]
MVHLTILHYIYIIIIVLIISIMVMKKDIVLPCIFGIGLIGYMATGSLVDMVQIIFRAVLVSAREFIEIIIIISLVNAMSKALSDAGADQLMTNPLKRIMTSSKVSFFVIGVTMMFTSWFIWPSPAVAFIGVLMVPAAVKVGLPPIWAAVALNLFGNGAALSGDFFIQAAPSVVSKTAGVKDSFQVIKASLPLWIVMTSVTILCAYIIMTKDLDKNQINVVSEENEIELGSIPLGTEVIGIATPIIFFFDVILMYAFKLKGGEATALIGGTSVLIMAAAAIIKFHIRTALGEVTRYIKEGFMFGMKVFSPIIVIGAFFYLGSKETASEILGVKTSGFLADLGLFISEKLPLSKFSAITMQGFISALLGIGGSGFSGLPLIGTLSQVFSVATHIKREQLAALGQIITIWVGGGTIIPWSVAPVAAICDIHPYELVRKNIIPVMVGFGATIIAAVILF